jgi:hypothetical protein
MTSAHPTTGEIVLGIPRQPVSSEIFSVVADFLSMTSLSGQHDSDSRAVNAVLTSRVRYFTKKAYAIMVLSRRDCAVDKWRVGMVATEAVVNQFQDQSRAVAAAKAWSRDGDWRTVIHGMGSQGMAYFVVRGDGGMIGSNERCVGHFNRGRKVQG